VLDDFALTIKSRGSLVLYLRKLNQYYCFVSSHTSLISKLSWNDSAIVISFGRLESMTVWGFVWGIAWLSDNEKCGEAIGQLVLCTSSLASAPFTYLSGYLSTV